MNQFIKNLPLLLALLANCGTSFNCSTPGSNVDVPGFGFLWSSVGSLTGQQLIQKLRDAANGIVDNVGNESRASAITISAELNKNADNLDQILGSNVRKPLTEIRQSFETEIERSLVGLSQAQAFLNSLRTCYKSDVKELISGLEGTLTYNISNSVPWASDRPIILNARKVGTESFLGIRASNEHQILEITGANFTHNEKCEAEIQISHISTKEQVTANIVTISPRIITIDLPKLTRIGVYKLSIGTRRKNVFGCKDPNVAEATFVVLPEAKFIFTYSITPTCRVKETISFLAGSLHGTNDGCDGDRIFSQNFVLPEEWKYTGHNWNPTSVNGCEGSATYAGGKMVSVSYRCPKRGGILCSGARKWVHGEMTIYGEKETQPAGQTINGKISRPLKFGQSITTIPFLSQDCSAGDDWTLAVSATFPDGTKIDLPTRTGDTPLSSSVNGAAFQWNPASKSLSVSAPPANCGEY